MWMHVAPALVGAGLLVVAICAIGASEVAAAAPAGEQAPRFRPAGVRYQVTDVERSAAFYTGKLGFKLEQPSGPAFARVTLGTLTLWLSGPQSSGARPLPDGRRQEPGGWNRIALEVEDLPQRVAELRKEGLKFRNEIVSGPGGRQIQLEDPDGNPIELFEPAK